MMALGVLQDREPAAGGVASIDLALIVGAAVLIGVALFAFIVARELRLMSGSRRRTRRSVLIAQVAWLIYGAWHIIDVGARTPRWQEHMTAIVLGLAGLALLEGLARALRPHASSLLSQDSATSAIRSADD